MREFIAGANIPHEVYFIRVNAKKLIVGLYKKIDSKNMANDTSSTEQAVQDLIRNHEYRVARSEMRRDEARKQLFVQSKDRDGRETRQITNAEYFRNNTHRDGNRVGLFNL